MKRLKCKKCGRYLERGETAASHYEICGGIDDEEAESMGTEDIKNIIEEEVDEDEDDWYLNKRY